MMRKTILPTLALLLASLACTLTDGAPALNGSANATTTAPATETISQEGATAAPAQQASQTPHEPTATPEAATPEAVICFAGDYDGLVRVRECGGLECGEIAILPAGTGLVLVETITNETGTWTRIASPIQGWLNARYACEVEQ
jgi:hypothetical protein